MLDRFCKWAGSLSPAMEATAVVGAYFLVISLAVVFIGAVALAIRAFA